MSTNSEFIAERDLKIAKMRQTGIPLEEVAKRFGISPKAAHQAYLRQLRKANQDFSLAAPHLIREMLDQMDMLMQAQWPLTQHRGVKLPDGTTQMVEPDPKATQTVLQILRDKAKLLGLDRSVITLQADESMKAALAGAERPQELSTHTPEVVGRELVEIMLKSGILPEQFLQANRLELESPKMQSLAEIEQDLADVPEEHETST